MAKPMVWAGRQHTPRDYGVSRQAAYTQTMVWAGRQHMHSLVGKERKDPWAGKVGKHKTGDVRVVHVHNSPSLYLTETYYQSTWGIPTRAGGRLNKQRTRLGKCGTSLNLKSGRVCSWGSRWALADGACALTGAYFWQVKGQITLQGPQQGRAETVCIGKHSSPAHRPGLPYRP